MQQAWCCRRKCHCWGRLMGFLESYECIHNTYKGISNWHWYSLVIVVTGGFLTMGQKNKKCVHVTMSSWFLQINNAGYANMVSFQEIGPENMDAMYNVHIRAPMLVTKRALPELLKNKGGLLLFCLCCYLINYIREIVVMTSTATSITPSSFVCETKNCHHGTRDPKFTTWAHETQSD